MLCSQKAHYPVILHVKVKKTSPIKPETSYRFHYPVTYSYVLTPWSTVFLKMLIGSRLVKKFPEFYGTRRFITSFTNARHLPPSWARSTQSMPPHSTSWRSILILSSHLSLGLPSDFFPQVSPPKPCIQLYSPTYVLHAPPTSFFSIWLHEKY